MSQLTRHIEYLLLEHDQVAVPGLGTFVCKAPVLHDGDDNMFYVPRRDVAFIATAVDDDVLVSHLSRQEHITPEGCRKKIDAWVDECMDNVRDYGVADLGNLGQMVMDSGNMVFQPCKAGLSSPSYYGLDNFEMPVLPLLATQIKQAVERADNADTRAKQIVIRINRTFVNYVASIAASIVLFFAFTTPTTSTVGEASFAPGFFVPTTVDDVQGEAEAANEEQAVVAEPVGFAVVIASSIKRANAEALIERLRNRGIDGAQVLERGGMLRVVFVGYATRAEAAAAAARLRTQDKELEGAWVYEIK